MFKTNNSTGKNLSVVIGLYFIVKSVINLILGGGFGDIIFAAIEAAALYTGLMFVNYVVAVLCVLVVLLNLKNNITNLGSNWFYLLEGVVDVVCAVLLVTNKDIKEHFSNKWSELSQLFKK